MTLATDSDRDPGADDGVRRAPVRFDERSWHTYAPSVSPDGSAFAYIVDDGTGYPRAAQRSLSRDGVCLLYTSPSPRD